MSRWFRHYAGMMRDDKLVRVALRSGQTIERVLWVWGAILESASEINENGEYDLDAAEVAYFLRADIADVDAVLGALEASGRISGNRVVRWGDRQFSSDTSAERQRRYRNKKRSEEHKVDQPAGDAGVTSPSRHGDGPETDTDTEKPPVVPRKRGMKPAVSILVPDWVPGALWLSFAAMRERMEKESRGKVIWSADAAKGVVAKLDRLRVKGHCPEKLLEKAIVSSWRTVFEDEDTRAAPGKVVVTAEEYRKRAERFDRIGMRDDAAECRKRAAEQEQARAA